MAGWVREEVGNKKYKPPTMHNKLLKNSSGCNNGVYLNMLCLLLQFVDGNNNNNESHERKQVNVL